MSSISFSGSHRNNECGTKIHGNDSEEIFATKLLLFMQHSHAVYVCLCAYICTFPTPFSLFVALQNYSFYTYSICVSECMYVWAATKFQGQSYKIIV